MNILYLRIRDLANEKGISLAQIERDLNLSNGSISSWRKGKASQDKILAIANYFNVSTDYLLGNTESRHNDDNNLTIDEAIDHAMSFDGKPISNHDRQIIKSIVDAYLSKSDDMEE